VLVIRDLSFGRSRGQVSGERIRRIVQAVHDLEKALTIFESTYPGLEIDRRNADCLRALIKAVKTAEVDIEKQDELTRLKKQTEALVAGFEGFSSLSELPLSDPTCR
jgi:hypothetical protein